MANTTRYGTTHAGHEIELDFDRSKIVLNQARLIVDGDVVDKANVFYGDKHLTTTLPDGTEVHVTVDSGMMGELRRAQLRGFRWVVDRSDGAWGRRVSAAPAGAAARAGEKTSRGARRISAHRS